MRRIAELLAGSVGGTIGVTFTAGKRQPDVLTASHRCDLGADLHAVAA